MNDLLSEKTITDIAARLGYSVYKFPRPGVCADVIVSFSNVGKPTLEVLLIKRGGEPYKGEWALPGGFVNEGETFKQAAIRELSEETGLEIDNTIAFVQIADKPGRDPRGWTISGVFAYNFCAWDRPEVKASDDAVDYKWFDVNKLPKLAFDHRDILISYFDGKGYYANQ